MDKEGKIVNAKEAGILLSFPGFPEVQEYLRKVIYGWSLKDM